MWSYRRKAIIISDRVQESCSYFSVHEINHSEQVQEVVTAVSVPSTQLKAMTVTVLSHNMGQ